MLNIRNTTQNESNVTTGVPYERCYPENWRDYFVREIFLLKIINAAGLTQTHEFVELRTRYLIDYDRIVLIVLLRRKDTDILDKLIIDVISRAPKFEQIMDALYVIGVDSDFRIILYARNVRGMGDYHPVIGSKLTSLMKALRGRVFLTVIGIDLEVNDANTVDLRFHHIEAVDKDGKDNTLPEREMLERAEFWGPCFSDACGLVYNDPDCQCDEYDFNYSLYTKDWGCALWNKDEMLVTYDIGHENLIWLLTTEPGIMRNLLKYCSIGWVEQWQNTNRNDCPGEPVKVMRSVPVYDFLSTFPDDRNCSVSNCQMIVRIPIPFRNFVYSSPADKIALATTFEFYASEVLSLKALFPDPGDNT